MCEIMTAISVQTLLDADYTEYHGLFDTRLFQKRVHDEIGLRYFITFYHGIHPARSADEQPRPYFFPRDQFTHNGLTFNIEVLLHDESIEQIERFWADTWVAMGIDYYEVNDQRSFPQPLPVAG
jgi:hypothetical protein